MLKQIHCRVAYFIPVFIFLLFSFACCLLIPKQLSFLFLNNFHTQWMDAFFTIFTNAGDGWVSIAVVILFALFRRRKEAITFLSAYLLSGLAAQLIKHLFNQPRPKVYLEQLKLVYHHFVEGVVVYGSGSFPSGHSASAFAIATVFVLLYDSKLISIIAFILAALVCYSRIYLALHFLQDVTAGALLGVFFGMLSYYVIWQQEKSFPKPPSFTKRNDITFPATN